jgi:hypothetical protein
MNRKPQMFTSTCMSHIMVKDGVYMLKLEVIVNSHWLLQVNHSLLNNPFTRHHFKILALTAVTVKIF